jgi:hypothetical protein
MWRRVYDAFRLLSLLFWLTGMLAYAQQNPKRLIMKDGSYQPATQWQIIGNRVRYFSSERYSWEELPKDLVDWAATDKYNEERLKQKTVNASEIARQDEAERRAEEAVTPTVAPGLRLPNGGGVFLLDRFQNRPQLVELVQSGGELNRQMRKNILRAALNPLALSSHQTIELKGEHARVQAHQPQPEIYLNVDSARSSSGQDATPQQANDKSAEPPDRYRIIRLEPRKDVRVVGNLNIAVYGKVSQKENWIKTTAAPVGEWVKVTPAEPLPPGEYALVEMLDKNQMNLYVWDFGVNPAAPANATAWTPRQPTQTQTGTNDTPILDKRPK